jgi:hypothetical protein
MMKSNFFIFIYIIYIQMPKYFHWHAPNSEWDAELAKFRCEGTNKDGTQCKERAVIIGLPLCFQHTASVYHLKIKQSTIPNAGLGLFAYDRTKADNEIVFKPGDDICNYFGEVVTKEILDARYGDYTAPYGIVVSANQNKYEDTAIQRGIGSLINHQVRSRTNCRFVNNHHFIKIRAHKNIRNGVELFINYGNDYRFDDEVQYSTNTKVRTL